MFTMDFSHISSAQVVVEEELWRDHLDHTNTGYWLCLWFWLLYHNLRKRIP